jgi:neutral ceramidase
MPANPTQTLLAGTGRTDITPAPGTPQGGWGAQTHERGTGADMPLYVTALALAQGETRILILDADSIGFDADWTAKILDTVATRTAIPKTHIRFSCSHTHSGPNTFRLKNISTGLDMALAYLENLPGQIAEAASQAIKNLQPIRIGAAKGECRINRNRRVLTPTGECVVGINEQAPADHTLQVLRLDREDGSTLASIVHYACHATTAGWQCDRFTPDFPGPTRQLVEQQLGGHCLFLQGAAGDLGPRRGFTGDLSIYHQLGKELGLAAASLATTIDTHPEAARFVSVMPSGANIAQYEYDALETAPPHCRILTRTIQLPLRTFPGKEKLAAEFEALSREVRRLKETGDTAAAQRTQAQATQMGWRLENARLYGGQRETPWPMQIIRIGPIALVSAAGEPFSSIGQRIREASPFPFTLVSGYSNGGFGYIPDSPAYTTGGYEVEATPFSPDATDTVVNEALKSLNEIFQEEQA